MKAILSALAQKRFDLARAIEAAGASPELTTCIILCGELGDMINFQLNALPALPPAESAPPADPDFEVVRDLYDHKLNGLNEAISITALDQPGPGGANHRYAFCLYGAGHGVPSTKSVIIEFQNGPLLEAQLNGFSNEAFLAMIIDRMRGFQYGRKPDDSFDENIRGKFACRDNAIALTLLEDALMRLQKRTRDRLARGVEGRHVA